MAKAGNVQLGNAKKEKKDEFYTQLADINAELRHYTHHFAGKVVFCNCDDPYESNFFKYFAANFNALKLKRLIATCYAGSPVAGRQLELFDWGEDEKTGLTGLSGLSESSNPANLVGPLKNEKPRVPHKIVINEVKDVNGDGRIDLADVEWLIKNDKNVLTKLEGDGDFRSAECIALLKEADIVVTNPPFSLFREYVAQLVQYGKKFLIIGNKQAIKYKEIFPLIRDDKLWLGYTPTSREIYFDVPQSFIDTALSLNKDRTIVTHAGRLMARSSSIWYTNLEHKKRHEEYVFVRRYTPEDYPHYANYDAIDVSESKFIPEDWDGMLGVPITFLDKYNPEQFEIIGIAEGDSGRELGLNPIPKELKKINPSLRDGQLYLMKDGKPVKPFSRIIIRRKT